MKEHPESAFSLKNLFVPLTTSKIIHFIILIGLIVYFNSLFNGFVIDDITYIVNYSPIHSFDLLSLLGKNIFNFDSQYRPIPAIYFALLYALFNTNVFYYHALQLILHFINTILVFFLFRHFFNKHISFLTALVFLVHPMQVESVSYISASDNPMFFLFGISAMLLSLKNTITWRRFCAMFSLLLVSLLTKETGVLFMGIIFVYRTIFNRKQLQTFFIFSVLTVLVYLAIRFGIGGIYFPQGRQDLLPVAPLQIRLLTMPLIFFYYIWTFFYPIKLAVSQVWLIKQANLQTFYLPIIIDLLFFSVLAILGIYIGKKNTVKGKIFMFFYIWLLAGLIFHSQIFPLDMTVADRWFYFSIVGILGLFGTCIYFYIGSIPKKIMPIVYTVALIIITFLSLRTIVRNNDWMNNKILYSHDISVSDNYQIETSLGTEYYTDGNYPKALIYFKRSANFLRYGVNLANIGSTYEMLGDKKQAIPYFSNVIDTYGHKKRYPFGAPVFLEDSYVGLARISLLSGKYNSSKITAINGLTLFPSSADLWMLLAIDEYKQHNQKDALLASENALKYQSDQETNQIYWYIYNNKPLSIQFNSSQN